MNEKSVRKTRVWHNPDFSDQGLKSPNREKADELFEGTPQRSKHQPARSVKKTGHNWRILQEEEQEFLANMLRTRAQDIGTASMIITMSIVDGEARIEVESLHKGRKYREPLIPPQEDEAIPQTPTPRRYRAYLDFGIEVTMPDGTKETLDWIK